MAKFKLILATFIALMCLQSCGRGDVLSKQQLEDMLFEMHFSDGVFHTFTQRGLTENIDSVFRYKHIFEKYKCSRDKFEKSLREYSRNKETLEKIYANLQKRFEEMLKNYEGRTFLEFTTDVGNKFSEPFKSIIKSTRENFESIENFTDFIEKLMNADENKYHENAENLVVDSVKQVMPNNQILQKINH